MAGRSWPSAAEWEPRFWVGREPGSGEQRAELVLGLLGWRRLDAECHQSRERVAEPAPRLDFGEGSVRVVFVKLRTFDQAASVGR